MAEDTNEHLGSSDCSSGIVAKLRYLSAVLAEDGEPNSVIAEAANRIESCDCREYRYEKMRSTLIRIMIWAEHDAISGETRQKAMADIAKACHKALEG